MKITKIKVGILFFILFIVFFQIVSVATYQTKMTETEEIKNNESEILEEVIISQEEEKILNLINKYREENGLTDLKINMELQQVAKMKAEDLVENGYFSHTSPTLGTPFELMKNEGVTYKTAGENLAGNTTVERAIISWINSEEHRDNILEEDYMYTGICVMESPIYGKVFVQMFIGV